MLIPDILLINTLNTALTAVRNDYNESVQANQLYRSFLYLSFKNLSLGNYVVFDNAKKLIITTPQDPNHLDVKGNYDKNINNRTFVYVTLGSESDRNNSIGIGIGDNEILTFNNTPEDDDEYKSQFSRRYATTYNLMIGGENKNEVIVLYNLFKSILTVCINHLSLEGLSNIKLGGQDIRNNNSIPDNLFLRPITISFEYEEVVPELAFKEIVRKIRLYWKPEGATVAQGPIEFSNEDDITDSDSTS